MRCLALPLCACWCCTKQVARLGFTIDGPQSLLDLRQQDLANIPKWWSAHRLPPRLLFRPRCWRATTPRHWGNLNSVYAVWVTGTESLFQLTTCFQNLGRVYWPPLRSGMRQLTPNPVVIILSMWTSPAGMMGFEKSWKYWCKIKVSECKSAVFYCFSWNITWRWKFKAFYECLIQNRSYPELFIHLLLFKMDLKLCALGLFSSKANGESGSTPI